jgi:hypothetical protein
LPCLWDVSSLKSLQSLTLIPDVDIIPRSCSKYNINFQSGDTCLDNTDCNDDAECMGFVGQLLRITLLDRFSGEENIVSFLGDPNLFYNAFVLSEFVPMWSFLPISVPFWIESMAR